MTYALVTVQKPAQQQWPDGLDYYTLHLPKEAGVQQIAESAWLINLDTGLLALANLITGANKAGYPCHAIFFHQRPDLQSLVPKPVSS